MNELFTTPKTPEGRAYNLMQMLKIKDLEKIVEGWTVFAGNILKIYNITKSEEEKATIKELFRLSNSIIKKNVDYVIKIYEIRQPLYKKYGMLPEDFRNYIEEFFSVKVMEIIEETTAKKGIDELDFKAAIERFEKNLEKVAIYAGHCHGEDLYPTETKEVQEVQRQAFKMTKNLIEENIEATIKVYKLIYKLAPEELEIEPKEYEIRVKDYLKKGISVRFEEGTLDIKKKFNMFQKFESFK